MIHMAYVAYKDIPLLIQYEIDPPNPGGEYEPPSGAVVYIDKVLLGDYDIYELLDRDALEQLEDAVLRQLGYEV